MTATERTPSHAPDDIMSQDECAEYGHLFETLDGARVFAKILRESISKTM